ncbi:HalOD1 output domain-containing protein [Natrarchaeobius chitinivorans]|uniref:Halobacterial output domain-containing protein n=1 Tax=Natrarchaeobius chitinivorans TaxID=1679083 RepID=A0A3N6M5N6_NATCH|nr:HalOD1 output domain-containing protein [Natrarchaeobius chitinivorans]RQG90591.1 hypothetical protein EA473_20795 [Natrarchaeobius chitinivorans]
MDSISPRRSVDMVTYEVVRTIAEREDINPTELDPPLHTAINTEAVNQLFEPTTDGSRSGSVWFEYGGWTVRVLVDDSIDVKLSEADP